MNKIPTLSTEALWREYRQSKDIKLRDKLAAQNDKLALKIAYRCSAESPEPIEDLQQLARMGMLKAIERFDPDNGAAFSSFSVPYIRGAIQHFQRDQFGNHVKVPRRTFEQVGSVKLTQKRLSSMGRAISLDECATAHGFGQEQWQWMCEAVKRKPLVSLEDALHLAADEGEDEGDRLKLHRAVLQQLALLPNTARQCLTEKFFNNLSDEQIAKRHKLSLPQLQELIGKTLTQLATQLKELALC